MSKVGGFALSDFKMSRVTVTKTVVLESRETNVKGTE